MAYTYTTPVDYQNVPLAKVVNCENFPKGCCAHKERHLSWDFSHPNTLPQERKTSDTPESSIV